jgi:HAD superfamily hydrolase (TIGR01490 family)
MKLVIFDFCETLCKTQTANNFIEFCNNKLKRKNFYISSLSYLSSNILIIKIISKLFPKFNFSKKVKLYSLKGVTQNELTPIAKEYFNFLLNNLNLEIVTLLYNHVNNDDHVIIVSGGYFNYLTYFKDHFNIKAILASNILFRNNTCTGILEGKDCMFDEKIFYIENYIKKYNLNFENSVCYTDSISDISLLKWVGIPVVVSNKESQSWVKKNNFKEIIINKTQNINA